MARSVSNPIDETQEKVSTMNEEDITCAVRDLARTQGERK
jgi:hypothetical protein